MKLRINWTFGISALLFVAVIAAACGGDDSDADSGGLKVVTSTGLLADIVSNVAGEAANVESVVPANADAHTFSLTPGDARKIADADVVFLAGANLSAAEREIERLAEGAVVTLADGLALFEDGSGVDPHFWMDPLLVSAATEIIEAALVEADPERAAGYMESGKAYRSELASLDSELADLFGTGQEGPRPLLVTFHDAFGYLARRYDLTVLGFVVEGPEEEPSASDIADLVDAMKREGAKVIFKEPQFDARVVEQVAAEAGAEIRDLPSATLTDEYPTYVAFMRIVAKRIVE
jgi:ABC-type Zn uptake system ZnuABC Zn-binding protein ZnuA